MSGNLSPYSQPKPPKTITQVKDDRFLDFTCLHTWIMLFAIALSLACLQRIILSTGTIQTVYACLFIVIIAIWVKYFSTFDKVDEMRLKYRFFISELSGEHTINKFSVPVSFLEKLVPIVDVHEKGIIEFKDGKFGILMETFPVRISEEERAAHEKRLEKVNNGIPANTHFKTIACSRLEPRKPLLNYLLEVTNKSSGDNATDLHLAGLYTMVAEDNSKVISWKYYAFLSLGDQKSIAAAKIQYGAVVPGLLKNLRAARLQPRIYETEIEISTAYRTMFSEMVV